LLLYILFAKYIYILPPETASPGNQHCANCIGTFLRYYAKTRRHPQNRKYTTKLPEEDRDTATGNTHPFNGPLSGTTRVSQYQKGETNLDFTEARDSEWQWHQLGHMQVCTSLQADNHASTPPLSFLQAGCPSCRPTNSVKALKGTQVTCTKNIMKVGDVL